MSYIYSRALVEEYLPANCLDTDAFVPSNSSPTPKPCLWHDKTMEPFLLSRFGMTCAPLTEPHGEALLTSFVAAFRVRTSAQPEAAQALTAHDLASGAKWPASSVRYDLDSHSWKTAHCLWDEDLPWSSVTLPKWGMTRNGRVYRHPTAERPISATGSGLWPTPTVCGNHNRKGASANSGDGLATAVTQRTWPTATASASKGWSKNLNRANSDDRLDYTVERENFQPGQQTPPMRLNPGWVEWLMGWPIGHTGLKPLATDKCQEWQRQHSLLF
jgi:hypothetical protein